MANRITVYGIEAELESGLWTSADSDLAYDLNLRCSSAELPGASPDPLGDLLRCSVEEFDAVVVERDEKPPGVEGRVY